MVRQGGQFSALRGKQWRYVLISSPRSAPCFRGLSGAFSNRESDEAAGRGLRPEWDILMFLDQYDSNGLRNRGWRERFGCRTRMVG